MKRFDRFNREMAGVEEEFYEIDKKNKTALCYLEYEGPHEVFDTSTETKIPMMNDDVLDELNKAFLLIPDQYRANVEVVFRDYEGWDEAALTDVCNKNLMLKTKFYSRIAKKHNRLAASMCMTGILFILLSVTLARLWDGGSFFQDFIVYTLDIIATVPFWCAMEIYFIDNSENRRMVRNTEKRFGRVFIRKKEDGR